MRTWYERQQAHRPQIRRAGDAANQMDMLRRETGLERRSLSADRRAGGGRVME